MNPVKRNLAITMGIAAALMISAARADDATSLRTESSRLEHNTAVTGEAQANSRISQDFAGFAGSSTNADNLVTGLRRGTPVTLTTSSGTSQQPSSVSFTPPTRPMGNGNVYISLALAKQQLASLGVTQPTPEQLKAALVGGTITTGSGTDARTVTLTGVLTQRSQGMGWGNIAKSQGVSLGSVVSGMKSANHDLAAIHSHQVSAASAAATSVSAGGGMAHGNGIVTAAGGRAAASNRYHDNGIVTGAGAVRGDGQSVATGARGQGHVR
jgi:hypothetical protein